MNAPVIGNLGDRLDDDVVVYRGFAQPSFRDSKKNTVRYFAYLVREEDADDGLSIGLTPVACVRHLRTNHGYCQITVGEIRNLGHNLDVIRDPQDPDHAYICNLPLQTISDATRENAIFIARKLAAMSRVATCDSYTPENAAAADPPEEV